MTAPILIGVDLSAVLERLDRLETLMATEVEQLTELKASLADLFADVQAKLDQLATAVSPEGQAILDEIKASVAAFDASIGDADNSDAPAEPSEPETPADPEAPVE